MAKSTKEETPVAAVTPAPMAGWFAKGEAGFTRKHQQDQFAAMRKEKGVPRLYLKPTPGNHPKDEGKDNEARVVFLDSAGFWIHEHNLKLEGKWANFFTCIKDYQPCEICNQLNDKSIYTCYFTVIDTRRYTRKDGSVSKYRKILYPAKGAAIDVVEALKKTHGDLRGLVVDIKRMNERDPNCGRDFNVVLKDGKVFRVDPSARFTEPEMATPFDYMKVLAPPTAEELSITGATVTTVVGSAGDLDEEVVSKPEAVSEEEMDSLLGDE